ncbi:MAG TPA: prephenate dehydratase [Chloroflexota bacterium]
MLTDQSQSGPAEEVKSARREIDRIDDEIVDLLNQRARWAQRIGAAKDVTAHGPYVPEREQEVLRHVREAGKAGPLSGDHLSGIYRQIISACRALEHPLRVAYLGPPATFTHQAATQEFGDSSSFLSQASIPDVFTEVQRGGADLGVVPVENSTDGAVHETLDSFVDAEVKVCGEIVLPIAFQLLGLGDRDQIETIYTNPVALAQCRQYIARNFPTRNIVTVVSTARAAELAAAEPGTAALANGLAAEEYGLNVIEADIQDMTANYTRFFVIAPSAISQPTGHDKTAVLFSIRDRVGALRDVVELFAQRRINLSSIQSRPSRRRVWEYVFFVELTGHEKDSAVAEALKELEPLCAFVKVLGSWARQGQEQDSATTT